MSDLLTAIGKNMQTQAQSRQNVIADQVSQQIKQAKSQDMALLNVDTSISKAMSPVKNAVSALTQAETVLDRMKGIVNTAYKDSNSAAISFDAYISSIQSIVGGSTQNSSSLLGTQFRAGSYLPNSVTYLADQFGTTNTVTGTYAGTDTVIRETDGTFWMPSGTQLIQKYDAFPLGKNGYGVSSMANNLQIVKLDSAVSGSSVTITPKTGVSLPVVADSSNSGANVSWSSAGSSTSTQTLTSSSPQSLTINSANLSGTLSLGGLTLNWADVVAGKISNYTVENRSSTPETALSVTGASAATDSSLASVSVSGSTVSLTPSAGLSLGVTAESGNGGGDISWNDSSNGSVAKTATSGSGSSFTITAMPPTGDFSIGGVTLSWSDIVSGQLNSYTVNGQTTTLSTPQTLGTAATTTDQVASNLAAFLAPTTDVGKALPNVTNQVAKNLSAFLAPTSPVAQYLPSPTRSTAQITFMTGVSQASNGQKTVTGTVEKQGLGLTGAWLYNNFATQSDRDQALKDLDAASSRVTYLKAYFGAAQTQMQTAQDKENLAAQVSQAKAAQLQQDASTKMQKIVNDVQQQYKMLQQAFAQSMSGGNNLLNAGDPLSAVAAGQAAQAQAAGLTISNPLSGGDLTAALNSGQSAQDIAAKYAQNFPKDQQEKAARMKALSGDQNAAAASGVSSGSSSKRTSSTGSSLNFQA